MPTPDLQAVFGQPAKEAVDYFARKSLMPSQGWETVSALEHQRAFTVAQTAGFNVLGDIQDAAKRAQREGWSHKQFQSFLEPTLKAKGWWGKAIDPKTGEITKMYPGTSKPVQYGSPTRLQLIYDTNMSVANAAGRRERQLAAKKEFPYWRYTAVMDRRTRPAHAALNGSIFPVDHSFWSSHYPPNGFRCRCTVQAVSAEDARAEGAAIQSGGEEISKLSRVNAAGDVMPQRGFKLADGREFYADAGFDVAHGNLKNDLIQLGKAFARQPDQTLPAAAAALAKSEAFALWRKNPVGYFPIALIGQKEANLIGAKTRTAIISPYTMAKQELEHPELSNADYALIQRTISEGITKKDTPLSLRYVLDERDKGTNGQVVVVKATKTGEGLFVTSMRRVSHRPGKSDREIKRLLEE